ncbi:hypothetical protein BCR44DRAFT_1422896 [Catenaria anguillulae PL171]|uniref:Uncharacterized protein n=1 Tax=Catenaria anguillulae PL171 TaxID=765915 RepID=A0A1Y2I416_9FUNG|nr:hypothetical protein BCR44DRAFT_1422896 [Catenaria anguillulae PL171]
MHACQPFFPLGASGPGPQPFVRQRQAAPGAVSSWHHSGSGVTSIAWLLPVARSKTLVPASSTLPVPRLQMTPSPAVPFGQTTHPNSIYGATPNPCSPLF